MKRKRIFEIIEKSNGDDRLSSVYDISMIIVIVLSLVPLAFKGDNAVFRAIDIITVAIFIVDYLLRWITADYRLEKGKVSALTGARYSDIL